MKQVAIFLLCFFCIFQYTIAQTGIRYEFAGTLQLKTLELITYKISFDLKEKNQIEGTSVTDIYGDERTITSISGTFDTIKGLLSFYESENISSKAKTDQFCFVHCKQLKLRNTLGKTIISGRFIGIQSNGKPCGNGDIYLIETRYLNQLANKVIQETAKKDSTKGNQLKSQVTTLKNELNNYKLTSNVSVQVNWRSEELIMEIWDGENVDQDEIAIYVNDRKLLDRIVIKRERKKLVVPLQPGENTIKVVALREGSIAPCTANLLLSDSETQTYLSAFLKVNESSTITLVRQP